MTEELAAHNKGETWDLSGAETSIPTPRRPPEGGETGKQGGPRGRRGYTMTGSGEDRRMIAGSFLFLRSHRFLRLILKETDQKVFSNMIMRPTLWLRGSE